MFDKVKVLIMDEPTSVLTEQETADLFLSLKKFSEEGILIIYITHKLKEVLSLCDEVAVMRKGKVVSISRTVDEELSSLANKMIGESLNKIKKINSNNLGEEQILRVSRVNFNSEDPYEVNLVNINFTLNKGECLGIAGISGNGQNELFQILSGETLSNNGSIKFRGKEISKLNPKERGNI